MSHGHLLRLFSCLMVLGGTLLGSFHSVVMAERRKTVFGDVRDRNDGTYLDEVRGDLFDAKTHQSEEMDISKGGRFHFKTRQRLEAFYLCFTREGYIPTQSRLLANEKDPHDYLVITMKPQPRGETVSLGDLRLALQNTTRCSNTDGSKPAGAKTTTLLFRAYGLQIAEILDKDRNLRIAVDRLQKGEEVKFGYDPHADPWSPQIGPAAQVLNEIYGSKYHFIQARVAGTANEKIRQLTSGRIDTAVLDIPTLYEAVYGKDPHPSAREFRVIAKGVTKSQIILKRGEPQISSLKFLEGGTIGLPTIGTEGEVTCSNTLRALGLHDKISGRLHIGFDAAGEALNKGKIHAYCSIIPTYPIASVQKLFSQHSIGLIGMTKAEVSQVTKAFPFYISYRMPQRLFPGLKTEGVETIAYPSYWVVSKDVSPLTVKDMLRGLADPETLKRLGQWSPAWLETSGDFSGIITHKLRIQPVAASYWQSRGFKVPMELVK